jgi:hypothetical protein
MGPLILAFAGEAVVGIRVGPLATILEACMKLANPAGNLQVKVRSREAQN